MYNRKPMNNNNVDQKFIQWPNFLKIDHLRFFTSLKRKNSRLKLFVCFNS